MPVAQSRKMSRAQAATWLREAGWFMISGKGNGCWLAPGWRRLDGNEYLPAGGSIKFYTWELAIRGQLILEERHGLHR